MANGEMQAAIEIRAAELVELLDKEPKMSLVPRLVIVGGQVSEHVVQLYPVAPNEETAASNDEVVEATESNNEDDGEG